MRQHLILILALLASPVSAQAPAAHPTCANARVVLPGELAGWSDRELVSVNVRAGEGASVMVGKAALVSLHPARQLALTRAPGKPFASNSYGGATTVSIRAAGKYRVALGGGAWVDLVMGGKAIASTAHGHGPQCSGIRKMVDFTLKRGTYSLQLSGSATDSLPLMIVKL